MSGSAPGGPPPAKSLSWREWVGFMSMVLGMFMAILDIQIVSASIAEIQAGLASGANTHFTFGHYEQAIGHFHRHLAEHVEMLKAARS